MISFKIDDEQIQTGDFWYHYKEMTGTGRKYCLEITRDELELIRIIENYSFCKITDTQLQKSIIEKDLANRSHGLIWHILNSLNKTITSDSLSWNWVINNIIRISVKENKIEIFGEIVPYKN